MTKDSPRKISLVTALLLFVVGGVALYLYLNGALEEKIDDLTSSLKVQITEQEAKIATIAEITARNGADTVTELIIKDCTPSDRGKFDDLLSSLDSGLSPSELTELERLFGRCGAFFAERKSVMVSRLAREVEVYRTYVGQLQTLTSASAVEEYQVVKWQELADAEARQSALFNETVTQQDNIISALLAGKRVDSEEISTILNNVQETQETLLVANKQASVLRSELISL